MRGFQRRGRYGLGLMVLDHWLEYYSKVCVLVPMVQALVWGVTRLAGDRYGENAKIKNIKLF